MEFYPEAEIMPKFSGYKFPDSEYHLTPTDLGQSCILEPNYPYEAVIIGDNGRMYAKWIDEVDSDIIVKLQKSVSFGITPERILYGNPNAAGYIYELDNTFGARRLNLRELDFALFIQVGDTRYLGPVRAKKVGIFQSFASHTGLKWRFRKL